MELHSLRRFPLVAALLACVAVTLLLAWPCVNNPHLAILALAPAMLAFGLFVGRRRAFHGVLAEGGLELENPPITIPYAAIEGLTINGFGEDIERSQLNNGPLVLMHRDGTVEIPAKLNVPSHEAYQAILARLPKSGSCDLSESLANHCRKEISTFGVERVFAFRRRAFIRRPSTRVRQICLAMLLLCGILWCLIPTVLMQGRNNAHAYDTWLVVGVMVSMFSFFGWLFSCLHPPEASAKKLRNAELVISPTGIALNQGDLQGVLRWEVCDNFHWRDLRGLGKLLGVMFLLHRSMQGVPYEPVAACAARGVRRIHARRTRSVCQRGYGGRQPNGRRRVDCRKRGASSRSFRRDATAYF
jgi:hypothetical protein